VLEEFRDQLPPGIFTEPPYSPPVSGKTQLDRGNMRRASALLDEAGWAVGTDGLRRNAAGETLSVEFIDESKSIERVVSPYVQNLRRIGIDARFSLIDAAQMQQRQEDFNFDMMPGRFSMSFSPSLELRQLFSSEAASAAGAANFSGIADPVVDALIERVIASTTREELDARAKALDRVLRSKGIWVPNWYSGQYLVAYWDVFGQPPEKPLYIRGDALWWFDDAKFDLLKAEGALR
jgi:microcin C transport system substrate-binding protein